MEQYLKLFRTSADYEAASEKPLVSHIVEGVEVIMPENIDYDNEYLTFVSLGDGTFKFSGNSVDYSIDNGKNWTTLESNTNSPTIAAGKKIMWKANITPPSSESYPRYGAGVFSSTNNFNVEGNPMSLLFGDNFSGQTSLASKGVAFRSLFNGCTKLNSAENLSLLATTLSECCYYDMFYGCSSLTTPPKVLPAETVSDYGYGGMFENCSSLNEMPTIMATSVGSYAMSGMFENCTNLREAKDLLVTNFVGTYHTFSFQMMFGGCSSLTKAPKLPATKLAYCCYNWMFSDCTSLVEPPELPATQLDRSCYANMFQGCTSLATAPTLPATTVPAGAYNAMFKNCKSLEIAPDLPAQSVTGTYVYTYQEMFSGCSKLRYIKCLATNINANDCFTDWVKGVASSGTFVKAASMNNWPRGNNGIPTNWTVENA